MNELSCNPLECPKKGDEYICDVCGFAVIIRVPCKCDNLACVSLACCGQAMTIDDVGILP